MAEVQWIKLNVGMFDGNSFKRIKKAKIGGEKYRDKLTAIWFELLDLAGKSNAGGQLIESPEIPFASIEDIAILIDREAEELELCMNFYITNKMVTVINDVYMLSNWEKYQNVDGLEKIREKNRKRQAKFKEKKKLLNSGNVTDNVTDNVTVTESNATDKEIDIKEDKERINKKEKPTLFDILIPNYQISNSLIEKTKDWLAYKAERNDAYKEQGLKSLLRQIENNEKEYGTEAVCAIIDESMANMWKGIIFEKLKNGSYDNKKKSHRTQFNNKKKANYDIEKIEKSMLSEEKQTAGNNENVKARAEALKKELAEKY